jgi:hypothetical protein
VSAEHEGLEGKHESVKPQNKSVHEREGVDGVQDSSPDGSRASCDNLVVVAASLPVAAPQQSERICETNCC